MKSLKLFTPLLILILFSVIPAHAQVGGLGSLVPPNQPRPVATVPGLPCVPRDFVQATDTGTNSICAKDGLSWAPVAVVGGSGVGTVTSVSASGGVETTTGSPITSTGTIRSSEPVNAQAGASSYAIQDSDRGKLITFTRVPATVAVSIAQAGTAGAFPANWYCIIKKVSGAAPITITPTTSTIDGQSSLSLATGQTVKIVSDGTNYQVEYFASNSASAGITNSAGANVVPKSDGTNLVASRITDDGATEIRLDSADGNVRFGDLDGLGNNSTAVLSDAAKAFTVDLTGYVAFGDIAARVNGTYIQATDATKKIELQALNEVVLGDDGGAANSTTFAVRDNLQTITATAGSSFNIVSPTLKLDSTSDLTATPTINTPTGIVRIASAGSTVTVTVTGMTSAWSVFATVRSVDTTLKSVSAVPGSGSFVLTGNAAAAANCDIQVWIIAPN